MLRPRQRARRKPATPSCRTRPDQRDHAREMHRMRRVPRLLPGAGRAGAIGGARSKAGSRLAAAGRGALTGAALLLAAILALAAYYMIVPSDFDGPGILGFIALTFPLHLLAVAIVAAMLGLVTWRCGAALGTAAFALVA